MRYVRTKAVVHCVCVCVWVRSAPMLLVYVRTLLSILELRSKSTQSPFSCLRQSVCQEKLLLFGNQQSAQMTTARVQDGILLKAKLI